MAGPTEKVLNKYLIKQDIMKRNGTMSILTWAYQLFFKKQQIISNMKMKGEQLAL